LSQADPFTTAFAKRLYQRQNPPGRHVPPWDALTPAAQASWLKHAGEVHDDYGAALLEVLPAAGDTK